MIVEVIAIGTELLLGEIINSNTAVIGAALAERGLDAHYQQTVGDNLERISACIKTALGRSDAVIITGGIGPTQDDITREAVCHATGLEMAFSESYADHLREWWRRRGREMPESNLRQAYHPEGAELIPNPRGTAPGLAIPVYGKWIFCVPGVPAEMEPLVKNEIVPRLTANGDADVVLVSRLLRTWGRAESEIAEVLDDLFVGSANPSMAFLASSSEIKIRLTAKAETRRDGLEMIAPIEREVRARLGSSVFGVDGDTIETILAHLLISHGYSVGVAESMTGGLITARLTATPGASKYVRGGVVPYQSDLKGLLLGVKDTTSVVDMITAVEMAQGVREMIGVDVGLSVTGSAGPEPMEQPVGSVFIGVALPDKAQGRGLHMPGDRERIRSYATTAALQHLRLALEGKWWAQ